MGKVYELANYREKKQERNLGFMITDCMLHLERGLYADMPLREIYNRSSACLCPEKDAEFKSIQDQIFTAALLDLHCKEPLVDDNYYLMLECIERELKATDDLEDSYLFTRQKKSPTIAKTAGDSGERRRF